MPMSTLDNTKREFQRMIYPTPIQTYAPRIGDNGINTQTPYFPYFLDHVSAFCNLRLTHVQWFNISSNTNIRIGIGIKLPRMLMRAPENGCSRSGRLATAAGCASKTTEVPINESVAGTRCSIRPTTSAPRKNSTLKSTP